MFIHKLEGSTKHFIMSFPNQNVRILFLTDVDTSGSYENLKSILPPAAKIDTTWTAPTGRMVPFAVYDGTKWICSSNPSGYLAVTRGLVLTTSLNFPKNDRLPRGKFIEVTEPIIKKAFEQYTAFINTDYFMTHTETL